MSTEQQYHVVSRRRGECIYLGENGTWWGKPEKGKRFSLAGAKVAARKSEVATGYEPVKRA